LNIDYKLNLIRKADDLLIIGVAYKKDINDLRESPALEVIKKLEEEKAIISYYDSYIPKFTSNKKEYKSLKELTAEDIIEKDMIIITTAHTKVDYKMVAENAKAVFDARNAIKLNSEKIDRL